MGMVTEEISMLNRREGSAATNYKIRDFTIIEADWYQPWIIWSTLAQLFNCEKEFFVLVTLVASNAYPRKAGDESQGIVCDRTPNLYTPVFARPQVCSISPHGDSGRFKLPLQFIDVA